jgi:hypothetical protein
MRNVLRWVRLVTDDLGLGERADEAGEGEGSRQALREAAGEVVLVVPVDGQSARGRVHAEPTRGVQDCKRLASASSVNHCVGLAARESDRDDRVPAPAQARRMLRGIARNAAAQRREG